MKALRLPVSEKKNFYVCLLCSHVQNYDPRSRASFDPRGIICKKVVEVHKMLNTKHQSSMPQASEKKNFEDGVLCSYVPTKYDSRSGATSYEQTSKKSTRRCYIPNMKALGLPV